MVEFGFCDSIGQVSIRNDALRSSSQEHAGVVAIHERSKLIGHSTIACSTTLFNVEVETINAKITERTRTSVSRLRRAKGVPHDISEVDTIIVTTKGITWCVTTNRYKDLLACVLTLFDIGLQLIAVIEHVCASGSTTALVTEIC